MCHTKGATTVARALAAFTVGFFFSLTALAQGPAINVGKGRIATAEEKKAMKAFRMKRGSGYRGDAEAMKLGDRLYEHARFNDKVELKPDKSNALTYVGRTDPSSHFRIDKTTGDFSFSKGMKAFYGDQTTVGLPRGDEAVEIAKKHLAALGLMPEKPEEMVVRHVGGLKQVDVTPDGKVQERDKLVTVHFGRQIDGIDVGGPGSKIVVELGENGELVSLHRRWIEVTPEKKAEGDFGGPAEVTSRVIAKMKKEAANARRVDAGTPDFGYYDDGAGNIEPAYFFDAELTYDLEDAKGGKREHKEKFHGVVPALKESKARFDRLEKAKSPPGRDKKPAKEAAPIKD